MSDKIGPHHLERKAILYVRQSSPYQVTHNEESRRLQYAMRDRLREFGWHDIEIVDEDLGQTRVARTLCRQTRCHFTRVFGKVSVLRSNERMVTLAPSCDNAAMSRRRIYDDELHAQFVTFSCYRRRRLLDHARARQVVISMLAGELAIHEGTCCGFVVMPDHVHAIVWFDQPGRLSHFMKQWKQKSSVRLKKLVRGQLAEYSKTIDRKDPFWQPRYYPFNLYSEKKAIEKLDYMHLNPVRAGLVEKAVDWAWSSARYFDSGESVGVPLEWIFS